MKAFVYILFSILYFILAVFLYFQIYTDTFMGDKGMVVLVYVFLLLVSKLFADGFYVLLSWRFSKLKQKAWFSILLTWLMFELCAIPFSRIPLTFGWFVKDEFVQHVVFAYSTATLIAISITEGLKACYFSRKNSKAV